MCTCLEQFENMINGDWSLNWILEIYFDDNLKFSPPGFCHFIRGFGQCAVCICIAVMELEIDLLHICRHILISERFNIDRPLMSVTIFFSFLSKIFTDVSINNWFDNMQSFLSDSTIHYSQVRHDWSGTGSGIYNNNNVFKYRNNTIKEITICNM